MADSILTKYYLAAASKGITLPSGSTSVTVPIPVTDKGWIHKILVKQASGTGTAFNLDILDHDLVGTTAPSADLAKVIPQQSAAVNSVLSWYSDHGYPFHVKVADTRSLYLVISVGSALTGDAVFDVAITWRTNDN